MKTLTIATAVVFSTCLVGGAGAQQPPPPQPIQSGYPQPYGYDPQAQPQLDPNQPQLDPNNQDDGYDAEYDVYADDAAAQNYDDGYDPQAYQQFESELSPYGNWIDVPDYGRVWSPSASAVGSDFSPYGSDGNWVQSDDYGWAWASTFSWGWAPFHYGRWLNAGGYGWCWMPGTIWGPGWVSWRSGGGYSGWAPLPPRGVTVGAPSGVRSPWRFVVAAQLGAAHPSYLPSHVVAGVFSHTSVVNNLRTVAAGGASVRINAGPSSTGAPGFAHAAVSLRSVAPQSLPRAGIIAHAGVAVAARPWVQNRAPGTVGAPRPMARPNSIPIGGSRVVPIRSTPIRGNGPRAMVPSYPARPYTIAQQSWPYRAAPVYHYNAPSPIRYTAPVSAPATYHYQTPSYSAPSYHYSAPSPVQYSAPAPSYHYSAPVEHYSAPAPSYHSSSGSFGGGGGRHR